MIAAVLGRLAVTTDTPPLDLSREEARRLAALELADPAYRRAEPSLLQRAVSWIIEQVEKVVDRAAEAAPGGWLGLLGLAALVLVVVLFVRWRIGPVTRTTELVFQVDPAVSAAEYRRHAEELAAAGRFDLAVTERMRALVRGAQEAGVMDAQPGWTADEAVRIIGAAQPQAATELARAAEVFDEVRYGGRPADAGTYEAVARAEDVAAGSRVA